MHYVKSPSPPPPVPFTEWGKSANVSLCPDVLVFFKRTNILIIPQIYEKYASHNIKSV